MFCGSSSGIFFQEESACWAERHEKESVPVMWGVQARSALEDQSGFPLFWCWRGGEEGDLSFLGFFCGGERSFGDDFHISDASFSVLFSFKREQRSVNYSGSAEKCLRRSEADGEMQVKRGDSPGKQSVLVTFITSNTHTHGRVVLTSMCRLSSCFS